MFILLLNPNVHAKRVTGELRAGPPSNFNGVTMQDAM